LSSLAGLDLHIKIPLASVERDYVRPAVILDGGGGVSYSKILGMWERERMICKFFYFVFITSRCCLQSEVLLLIAACGIPKEETSPPPDHVDSSIDIFPMGVKGYICARPVRLVVESPFDPISCVL
jgi:hypothetical protein